MLGFTPGFIYLGDVDDKIAVPRLDTPRTKVPAGSVGIAGKQTGLYGIESPGGWRLIGRTPVKTFDYKKIPPIPIKPGDIVKFYPITREEYHVLKDKFIDEVQ
jgi:KipI family sensor histidine kinase inhibitor